MDLSIGKTKHMKDLSANNSQYLSVEFFNANTCEIPTIKSCNSLGMHVILELIGCNPNNMSGVEKIQQAFHDAAKLAKCNIVTEAFHEFEPHGVSGVVVISESHLTYHGWDEHGYAAIDFFYCSDEVKISLAIEHIMKFLEAESYQITAIPRGFKNSV